MKKYNSIQILFRLISLLTPLLPFMLLAILLGVAGFLAAIAIPLLGGFGLLKAFGLNIGISYGALFAILLLCGLFRGLLRYGEQACNHFIAFKLLARIRDIVFGKLRTLAPSKLEGKDKGNLISLITSDIELLEVFYAHTISPVCIAFLVSLIFVILTAQFSGAAALWLATSYICVGVLLPLLFSKKSAPAGLDFRNQAGILNSYVLESVRGLKSILQFGYASKRLEGLKKQTDDLVKKEEVLKGLSANNTAAINTLVSFFSFGMILLCLSLYQKGAISHEGALLASLIQLSTFGPVIALANLGVGLAQTLGAGSRVLQILDEAPLIEEVKGGKEADFDLIQAEHIDFAYPQAKEQPILSDFSAKIAKGNLVGIVGASGCGKSTFLKLMMRFFDPDQGNMLADGINIKELKTSNIRSHISYVTQDTVLFADTIENNLRIAKLDATQSELEEACKKANIHDFIISLPDGYQSQVAELGSSLSGGERQRIGLARAFLHEGCVMLLDEPTSNLDSLNEGMILKAIDEQKHEKTIVLISHRKSSLGFCDEIIEMESVRDAS
jgi:ATP-binding cassette subfamily C protein